MFYDVAETEVQVLAIVTKAEAQAWLDAEGTPEPNETEGRALAEVRDDLSKYLRLAADGEIVITRHGRPAGILIGFASDEDWFAYRLEHHPEFLQRIEEARAATRTGRGIPLREIG